jgi:glycosyltransferase involved in cell wall biosynthesis
MRKKRILIHTNFSRLFTGFGKNAKNILRHLHKTGKYEVIELANGLPWDAPDCKRQPWQCHGSMPLPHVAASIKGDGNKERAASYGAFGIDRAINEIKPDVYLGIEDVWAFNGFWDKPWWNHITSAIWTTLDSMPILPDAVDAAAKVKNYFVWASFAEKGLKEIGYDNVKTVRGTLDTNQFYALSELDKKKLKQKFNLQNNFVVGFVFRNQLRKSVPNMLDGFLEFKRQNPQAKPKLLLHTHWSEGWDIPRLIREKNIMPEDVCTTYFCKNCKQYEIRPFTGQDLNCKYCGSAKSVSTTNITNGVNESQLNEIYNIMDVYCHPFTSGGQEIPVQEAKLTKLITLVTDYSCGEDYCQEDSGGMPLSWAEYREPGTQFIKASTLPSSIAKQLSKVYNMKPEKRQKMGEIARQFVIDNCSIENVCKQLEEFFDNAPLIEDWNIPSKEKNPNYPNPSIQDDAEWIIDLYKNMLAETIDKNSQACVHWVGRLKSDLNREGIYNHFRQAASQKEQKEVDIQDVLDKDDAGRRIAVVMPQSAGDVLMVNSLLSNLKELYPEYNIYFITLPQFFEIVNEHPAVHKILPYSPIFDNLLFLEGQGSHKGYFEIAFLPFVTTQKHFTYHHNGKDRTQIQLQ